MKLTVAEANAQFDRVMDTEYPDYFAADAAIQAAFDALYAAMDAEAADEIEEFTVVTEWSRMDSYGNYRDFTRTRKYRASTVAEAMDRALEDLPASCDAIIDQFII